MKMRKSLAISTSFALAIVVLAVAGVSAVIGAYYVSSINSAPLATTQPSQGNVKSYSTMYSTTTYAGYGQCSSFSVGSWIGGIVYDSHVNRLYVTDNNFNSQSPSPVPSVVYSVSPSFVNNTTTVPVGYEPVDIAFDPDNNNLYVANFGSNSISVVNDSTNAVVQNITSGLAGPIRIAYDPFNHDIYVSNRYSGQVSVIDTRSNTIVENISVTYSPFEIVYDASNHDIYVTDGSTSNVTVIDSSTNQIVGRISEGMGSSMLAYDSTDTNLYYFPQDSQALYVINGTTNLITGNISGIYDLNALGFDAQNNEIYGAGNASGGFLDLISASNNSIVAKMSNFEWGPADFAYSNGYLNGTMFLTDYTNDRIFALPSNALGASACESNVTQTPTSIGTMPTVISMPTGSTITTSNSTTTLMSTSCELPHNGTLILTVLNKTGSEESPASGAYMQGTFENGCNEPPSEGSLFGYITNSSGVAVVADAQVGAYLLNVTWPAGVHYYVNATVVPSETTCLSLYVPAGTYNQSVVDTADGPC